MLETDTETRDAAREALCKAAEERIRRIILELDGALRERLDAHVADMTLDTRRFANLAVGVLWGEGAR